MTTPAPWLFVLLAAAAWRTWILLVDDKILGRPRDWLMPPGSYRRDEFLECVYCAGAWVAALYAALWFAVAGDGVSGLVVTWLALSAGVVAGEGIMGRL